mmetsp:Transcript_534/g.961  ORF Transcript_534/g.961 Transcript_534/m.961 type:complete len:486 (-) Transcript_534:40-1497(-)
MYSYTFVFPSFLTFDSHNLHSKRDEVLVQTQILSSFTTSSKHSYLIQLFKVSAHRKSQHKSRIDPLSCDVSLSSSLKSSKYYTKYSSYPPPPSPSPSSITNSRSFQTSNGSTNHKLRPSNLLKSSKEQKPKRKSGMTMTYVITHKPLVHFIGSEFGSRASICRDIVKYIRRNGLIAPQDKSRFYLDHTLCQALNFSSASVVPKTTLDDAFTFKLLFLNRFLTPLITSPSKLSPISKRAAIARDLDQAQFGTESDSSQTNVFGRNQKIKSKRNGKSQKRRSGMTKIYVVSNPALTKLTGIRIGNRAMLCHAISEYAKSKNLTNSKDASTFYPDSKIRKALKLTDEIKTPILFTSLSKYFGANLIDPMDKSVSEQDRKEANTLDKQVHSFSGELKHKHKHKGKKLKSKEAGLFSVSKLNPVLADLLGVEYASRTEAISLIWKYIRTHDLQLKKDKRIIRCDEKMKLVLKRDQMSMFEMISLLSKNYP